MPDGVMKWFDSKTGEAAVARHGRLFPARARDIETKARKPGARVHFDIHRVHGVDEAVDVKLREGTRVSPRQHRFGTLVGARQVDTKGPAPHGQVHPELRSAVSHPLEVARAWASAMARGDVLGALSLYSPDAAVHVDGRSIVARRGIQGWLETTSILSSAHNARIHGLGDTAVIDWEVNDRLTPRVVVQCRISHSQIAEQWISEAGHEVPPARSGPGLEISLSTNGDIGDEAIERARQQISKVIQRLSEPVLFARLKLAFEPDPARPRPALAQVSIDVDGELVRAQVAGHNPIEAVDLLVSRLADQLEHRARRREHRHRRSATHEPGEWRHGDVPTQRAAYFDRPAEERQLVRHKMFVHEELTTDEAIFDMEQLDYDFFLFCDLETGTDSIIERLADGSYRLTRLCHSEADLGPSAQAIAISDVPTPVLSLEEATERLDTSGEHHVFFADATTGRANVVYRRYDGHYGLITTG